MKVPFNFASLAVLKFTTHETSQNTVLKTWQGKTENVKASQDALLKRAKANSDAQQGKYDAAGESKEAGKGMYEKGYVYCKSI